LSGLDADEIIRKLRLLALTSLAAKSSTKEISYQEAAQALKLEEVDVEIYVIDGTFQSLSSSTDLTET
jgi:translation initiation factor 3 subunit M